MTALQVRSLPASERARVRLSAIALCDGDDDIRLLRKARMLKTVNVDLRQAAQRRASGPASRHIQLWLEEVDQCLRSVLLSGVGVSPEETRCYLETALAGAWQVVSLTAASEPDHA